MKLFVNKIEDYTNGKVKLVIICNTHKIQSLFRCKDKIQHHSCEIYCSVSSCGTEIVLRLLEFQKHVGKNIILEEMKTVVAWNISMIILIMSFDCLFCPVH